MLDVKFLTTIIESLRNGTFFRLRYMSDMPVKAEYRKEGIKVIKLVNITTRTGINYSHITGVNSGNHQNDNIKDSSWRWILKNKIKFNKNTGKLYLVIAPLKNTKPKSQYLLNTPEGSKIVSKEEIKNYIIDSYWKKEFHRPINYISFENILSIH